MTFNTLGLLGLRLHWQVMGSKRASQITNNLDLFLDSFNELRFLPVFHKVLYFVSKVKNFET